MASADRVRHGSIYLSHCMPARMEHSQESITVSSMVSPSVLPAGRVTVTSVGRSNTTTASHVALVELQRRGVPWDQPPMRVICGQLKA